MSGNNALVVEMGSWVAGLSFEAAMEQLVELRGMWAEWKAEGLVDDVHSYVMVTGNRTERSFLVVFSVSHEQLEALVVHPGWVKLNQVGMQVFQNLTTNRAIDMDRMFTLASQ